MDETSTLFEDFPAFTGTAGEEAADEDDVDGVVTGDDGAAVGFNFTIVPAKGISIC